MSKIRVLDDQTINQIAAGEVIQNPSSVVKELVENALDAGSSEICIEISGGGRQLIRITDNGCGMSSDDALLCLERHATSKIKDLNDIYDLSTMGFRGEAVPSIASISKFTLLTCPKGKQEGTLIMVEGGRVLKCNPAARDPGTTIEVKALFFNVPVRKKFQRSPVYDIQEITKVITSLALGNPEVKFELISNQSVVFSTAPNETLHERAIKLLGEEFKSSCSIVDYEEGEIHLRGLIGLPHLAKHNRTGQHLFLNKRPVYSSFIAQSVREGFGTTLPTTRYPVFVLHIDLPGKLIDVNIHPQKREVKLRYEAELRAIIFRAIDKALQGSGISFSFEPPIDLPVLEPIQYVPDFSELPIYIESKANLPEKELFQSIESPTKKIPKILSTLQSYILLDDNDSLKLLDQKAAQSRVLFEKLIKRTPTEIGIQPLLIPLTLEVNAQDAQLINTHLETLIALGFQIQEFGLRTFIVQGFPQNLDQDEIEKTIVELVHQLDECSEETDLEQKRHKKLAYVANRAACGLNRKLGFQEAYGLLEQLMNCENSALCPLGNPIVLTLTPAEIARIFQK